MPSLLSGSQLRPYGSGTFIKLSTAQPSFPPTATTATGYTVIVDGTRTATYSSSLGNLLFTSGTITNQVASQNIVIATTGSAVVSVRGDLYLTGGMTATNTITGTITTATNITGGAQGSLPYQTAAGRTAFLGISTSGYVLVSAGTAPAWLSLGSLSSARATTATNSDNLFVYTTTATSYYPIMTQRIGGYYTANSTSSFAYDNITGTLSTPREAITDPTASTSTTTGALTVAGGVGVQGSVYSADGNPNLNNLLYSPQVYFGDPPAVNPTNPKVGEVWIVPSIGAALQAVQDGTSTIWIQFTTLA
jgi:hypothetical protein